MRKIQVGQLSEDGKLWGNGAGQGAAIYIKAFERCEFCQCDRNGTRDPRMYEGKDCQASEVADRGVHRELDEAPTR